MAKRFVNAPNNVVPDLMAGLSLNSSQITQLDPAQGHNVVFSSSITKSTASNHVAVVSGGGSGHEPMAGGYVSKGMLNAAVAGQVFASPSIPAISAMFEVVATRYPAILSIVMNYQGDRLNFKKATQDFQLKRPGYPIHVLLVGDDVSLPTQRERRGIAGTVFVLKIASAAAQQGKPFAEVVKIAKDAAKSICSFGMALEPCTLPGHALDTERLGPNELELGMGIHNERGVEKCNISSFTLNSFTNSIVAEICRRLDVAVSANHAIVSGCSSLVVMVNNLGAVSQAEMLIVQKAVDNYLFSGNGNVLNGNRFRIHMFAGNFMTSLQMTGISISCLVLPSDGGRMEQLLHAPTTASGWNTGFALHPPTKRIVVRTPNAAAGTTTVYNTSSASPINVHTAMPNPVSTTNAGVRGPPVSTNIIGGFAGPVGVLPLNTGVASMSGNMVPVVPLNARTQRCIVAITDSLLSKCDELTTLDKKTGDGDMGNTVRSGCEKIRRDMLTGIYSQAAGNPALLFKLIANSVRASMGGSSGALTASFFDGASLSYQTPSKFHGDDKWRDAVVAGTAAVMQDGGAKVGDRTMVDALKPAADILNTSRTTLAQAVQASRVGCESTKLMVSARFGRSMYVPSSSLINHADPGATAVYYALDAVARVMN